MEEILDMKSKFGIDSSAYIKTDEYKVMQKSDNKDTFVLILAFQACPYCRRALPLFDEINNKVNISSKRDNEVINKVYVLNPRNFDFKCDKDFSLFKEKFNILFKKEYNKFGELEENLYVPKFLYIKNGEIVYVLDGTVEYIDSDFRIEAEYGFSKFLSDLKG